MNPFPAYLHTQLADKLKTRRVVVWYDPNREFAPFIDSLEPAPEGEDALSMATIGGIDARLDRSAWSRR